MKKRNKNQSISLSKKDDELLFAFLGAFFVGVGFLLVFILRKENKYAMCYAKQGLVLFITALILSALSSIPIVGWIFSSIFLIAWIILWVITFVNSLSGKIIDTFLIGELAEKIRL